MIELENGKTHLIIKRDGRKEPYDPNKLLKVTSWACNNDENATKQLLSELDIKISDEMRIQDLYDELIKTTVNKISAITPMFDDIAKRLYLMKIYKETYSLKRIGSYPHLREFLKKGLDLNVYHESEFLKYKKINEFEYEFIGLLNEDVLNELNNIIEPERDLLFNYKGLRLFFDKYCKKKAGSVLAEDTIELPQITFMAAAIQSFLIDLKNNDIKTFIKNVHKSYELLSTFKVTYSTPNISFNLRNNNQFASCVLITPGDDTESLNYADSSAALYSKSSGGIAYDASYIRASGSTIKSNSGRSDGPIPFIKRLEQTVSAFNQAGCLSSNSYIEVIKSVDLTTGENIIFKQDYKLKEQTINKELDDFIKNKSINITLPNGYLLTKEEMYQIWRKRLLGIRREEIIKEHPYLTMRIYKRFLFKIFQSFDKTDLKGFKRIPLHENYLMHLDGTIVDENLNHMLLQRYSRKGYINVCINNLNRALHRLLYQTFVGPIPHLYTIDHINGIKDDNRLENLQVMTIESNVDKWKNEFLTDNEKKISLFRKSRLKRFLNYGHNLNGYRSNDDTEIAKINSIVIPIKSANKGDYVKCYNEKEKKIEYKRIEETHLFYIEPEKQYELVFENGTRIITSDHHPIFYLDENNNIKYKRTDEMKIGDNCITENNTNTKIIEINRPNEPIEFYDLTVFGNNNYFASSFNSKDKDKSEKILVHNTRAGAAVVYFPWWHLDIFNLINLKDAGGAEELRARKNKYSLKINRLLLERYKNNDYVTLFDPKEVPLLNSTYGEEFEKAYKKYEKNGKLNSKKVLAKDILYEFIRVRAETGNLYAFFVENVNEQNMTNRYISMSNLCCEITVPSRASKTISEEFVIKEDGTHEIILKKKDGEVGLCNLASINSLMWYEMNDADKDELIYNLLLSMDNRIDNQFYPVKEGKFSNVTNRPIGIGITDFANLLAFNKIKYTDPEALEFTNKLYDDIYYRIYLYSMVLASERGPFKTFKNTLWAKGITPLHISKFAKANPFNLTFNWDKWDKLGKSIAQTGVRFSLHGTLPPSACCSLDTLINTDKGLKTLKEVLNKDLDIDTDEIHKTMKDSPTWLYPDKSFTIIDKNGIKRKVTKVYYNGYRLVYDFITSNGKKCGSFTENHKFYGTRDLKLAWDSNDIINDSKYEWVTVKELLNMKEFVFISNGTPYLMSNLTSHFVNPHYEHTWDFEVEDVHEYCVGEDKIVCHNTSGKVTNATEACEPVMDLFYIETGTYNLPTIVKGRNFYKYYQRCWDVDNKTINNLAAIRQAYIDQSQSFNHYYTKVDSAKVILSDIMHAESLGLKTLYYLKTPKTNFELQCSSCSV